MDNLANTEEGKRIVQQFKKELEFTTEKPQVVTSVPHALPSHP
jgi:hypothetical protein